MDDEKGVSFYNNILGEEDTPIDKALRPLSFDDFTGQEKTKERLKIVVGAAKKRGEPLGHVLLNGPPGLGKTTLASIIGNELGKQVRITSGPVIEKAGDLAGLLTSLEEGDILFIDEIHRISKTVEEYLYSAMEDFKIDIMIDQGPNSRSIRLDINHFTVIGATTRMGLLTSPLRSRFKLQSRLDYYDKTDLFDIVNRTAGLIGVEIDKEGAKEIASRSRGTPRISNNLISFVRDYADQKADGKINKEIAEKALELLEISKNGLDEMDKRILRMIGEKHRGGPVGLNTIAVGIGEEQNTIEEVHEPFLIQEGYLSRTAQGRVLTEKGWQAVGLNALTDGDASQINLL